MYTSAGVMAGLAAIWIGKLALPGIDLNWVDPVAAIGVAVLIIRAAYRLTVESARDLLDVSLPKDEEECKAILTGDGLFDKIMIATDGSKASRHAACLGIGLARHSAGEVTAVYVVDIQRLVQIHGYTSLHGLKESLLDAMLKEGEEAVSYVEDMSRKEGVHCSEVILKGNPSDELLKYSKELKADMLVMGSIGRTAISRFLLGSVAENVVRHSEVPVMVVPFNNAR